MNESSSLLGIIGGLLTIIGLLLAAFRSLGKSRGSTTTSLPSPTVVESPREQIELQQTVVHAEMDAAVDMDTEQRAHNVKQRLLRESLQESADKYYRNRTR